MKMKSYISMVITTIACLVLLNVGTVFASAAPNPVKTLSTKDIIKQYDNSVVVVGAFDDNGELLGFGSGFMVAKGLFATNFHVLNIQGAIQYKIITNKDKEYVIQGVVKYDVNKDIAIIKTKNALTLPIVKLGSYKKLVKGDKIVAVGSPEGLQNTVSEGIVSGIRYVKEYKLNIIQITAPITHGSSGGPIFNNKGEVVGITTSGYEGNGDLNFAVAADHITAWTNELKAKPFNKISVVKGSIISNIIVSTDSSSNEVRLSNVKVNPITDTTAVVSWQTNKEASSKVQYGTNMKYDNETLEVKKNQKLHSVTLTGLAPNTTYNYKIISTYGNDVINSENLNFKTALAKLGANPGINRSVFVGFKTKLDGLKSNSGSDAQLKFKWRIISKPAGSIAVLENATLVNPTITTDIVGEYKIGLIVNNGTKDSIENQIVLKAKSLSSVIDEIDLKTFSTDKNYIEGYQYNDMVALSDGWVILGENTKNKIIILNILTGEVAKEYQLNASPDCIDYDADKGIILATQTNTLRIAKINILNDVVTYIKTSGENLDVVYGKNNIAFAYSKSQVSIIDVLNDKEIKAEKVKMSYEGFMVFSKTNSSLILGVKGNSPSSLYRYKYDETLQKLTLEQERWNSGSNGEELVISYDGNHIAFTCGGGNSGGSGNPYTLFDFNSSDINESFGEWKVEAYPMSAAFTNDNKYIVAANSTDVKIFDLSTHMIYGKITVDPNNRDVKKVFVSKGGKLIMVKTSQRTYYYSLDKYIQ
jgi:S1-C subfamily serine protease